MDMNINLNIAAPELCGAINNLANAVLGMGSHSAGAVEQVAPTTRKTRTTKAADSVAVETTKEEPAITENEPVGMSDAELKNRTDAALEKIEAAETEKAAPEVKTLKIEDVREKMKVLSAAGKNDDIKKLFAKFGAKKLTEVPAENYVELMELAEAIA